jgi:hypothetical protein
VSEVLVAQRRWGTTRCRKFLQRNGISELKPIGELTDRQRRMLATALSECASLPLDRAAQTAERELALV